MSRHHLGGRHRFGAAGLRYCRTLPSVQQRLEHGELHRHASGAGTLRVRPALAVGFGAAVAAIVSGWFTAGQALAEQISHH